jgi:hypothetical protein
VIILTFTPRLRAQRIVSALSWRGGSKSGNNPQNSQGPPALSLFRSGTSCIVYNYTTLNPEKTSVSRKGSADKVVQLKT